MKHHNPSWQKQKLEDVTSLIIDHRGKTPKKLGGNWATIGIPALSAKNIKDGNIINRQDIRFVNQELYHRWMTEKLEKDDILMTSEAPLGELYILNEKKDYCLSQRLFALRADKKKLVPGYLYYFLKSNIGQHQLHRRISGTAAQGIRQAELRQIEVTIPPDLNAQSRIASILSAFYDKIELNNKINATLEKTAQEIFKEWFVKGKNAGTKSEKLSNLVRPQYGYTESANEKKIGPKFLRVKDINKSDWIDWEEVPYCKISNNDFKKYHLLKGDIVIARMADPGKVAIIEQEIEAVFASYLIRFHIIDSRITPYFLYYFLRSSYYQNFVFGTSTGTTRRSANARMLTDCEITIPNINSLIKFEKITSGIREKIAMNVRENNQLAKLRDLLLPKLMKGEVRV